MSSIGEAGVPGYVGVNLHGFDAGVTQQILNHQDIRTGFHQMRGVRVAQHVQGYGAVNACPVGGLLNHLLQTAFAVPFPGQLSSNTQVVPSGRRAV